MDFPTSGRITVSTGIKRRVWKKKGKGKKKKRKKKEVADEPVCD